MSTPKQITFLSQNPRVLTETVKEFCDPVISTLGPSGCTVIIDNVETSLPQVTKDGVTVAESIFFADRRQQAIASLIKEAARKTSNTVGDGTTTSIVLTKAMILEGLAQMKVVKSKREFFNGFDNAFEKVIDILTENSVSITKDSELLESVVKIAVNGDSKICKTIVSAVKAAGKDGLIEVELGKDSSTIIDVKGGSSLRSNTFINGKRKDLTNSHIELILVSGPIRSVYEIKDILNVLKELNFPAIIIAKEFSEAVINTVSVNNSSGRIDVSLVESEGFTRENRLELLKDLGSIFSVPVYSTDGSTSIPLSSYSPLTFSEVSNAIITSTETVLFRNSKDLSEDAEERYSVLKKAYDDALANSEKESIVDQGEIKFLQRRIAKYNIVAVIVVGAATKAEASELKDRIDDALCSIESAVNGGISQGGGMALYKISDELQKSIPDTLTADERIGYMTFLTCCRYPFKVLEENSGIKLKVNFTGDNVYDFKTFEVVNYIDGGIVDPTLVPITALTNSSSVAKTILKSNSIVSEWLDRREE